jgi:hypothetical protein
MLLLIYLSAGNAQITRASITKGAVVAGGSGSKLCKDYRKVYIDTIF